jgi:hypothetical protein
MPVWAWVLLIAVLSALAVGAVMAILRATHRLPHAEPLHGDAENFAAPLRVDTAESMTLRELDAEETHTNSRGALSRDR